MSKPETAMTQWASTVEVFTPAEIITGKQGLIEQKQIELEAARTALAALKAAGAGHSRIDRVRERVKFIQTTVNALQAGYVPIPRFDSSTLNLDVEELPARALVALAYAQNAGVFDEVRIVRGQEPAGGRGRQRREGRDPLLIGVIRSPNHELDDGQGRWDSRAFIPGRTQYFLIAWWQPEDEHLSELF